MTTWKIAGVQMDCAIADVARNLAMIQQGICDAASQGAQLIIFPECALTGYGYRSLEEALPHAQPLPGPASDTIAQECRRLGVHVIAGMLERGEQGEVYNACMLVGPTGFLASYRKIHIPYMGVDRFVTPGNRPFAVHELEASGGLTSPEGSADHNSPRGANAPRSPSIDGLRVGMNICYDGSFPESARVLTILGADLVVLPTNWPTGARPTVAMTVARVLENNIYYVAVNRVGEERGFRFIGQSRILAPDGTILAEAPEEHAQIIMAEIDPAIARNKRVVKIPGEHEIDRVGHRRPEMYGPLTSPVVG